MSSGQPLGITNGGNNCYWIAAVQAFWAMEGAREEVIKNKNNYPRGCQRDTCDLLDSLRGTTTGNFPRSLLNNVTMHEKTRTQMINCFMAQGGDPNGQHDTGDALKLLVQLYNLPMFQLTTREATYITINGTIYGSTTCQQSAGFDPIPYGTRQTVYTYEMTPNTLIDVKIGETLQSALNYDPVNVFQAPKDCRLDPANLPKVQTTSTEVEMMGRYAVVQVSRLYRYNKQTVMWDGPIYPGIVNKFTSNGNQIQAYPIGCICHVGGTIGGHYVFYKFANNGALEYCANDGQVGSCVPNDRSRVVYNSTFYIFERVGAVAKTGGGQAGGGQAGGGQAGGAGGAGAVQFVQWDQATVQQVNLAIAPGQKGNVADVGKYTGQTTGRNTVQAKGNGKNAKSAKSAKSSLDASDSDSDSDSDTDQTTPQGYIGINANNYLTKLQIRPLRDMFTHEEIRKSIDAFIDDAFIVDANIGLAGQIIDDVQRTATLAVPGDHVAYLGLSYHVNANRMACTNDLLISIMYSISPKFRAVSSNLQRVQISYGFRITFLHYFAILYNIEEPSDESLAFRNAILDEDDSLVDHMDTICAMFKIKINLFGKNVGGAYAPLNIVRLLAANDILPLWNNFSLYLGATALAAAAGSGALFDNRINALNESHQEFYADAPPRNILDIIAQWDLDVPSTFVIAPFIELVNQCVINLNSLCQITGDLIPRIDGAGNVMNPLQSVRQFIVNIVPDLPIAVDLGQLYRQLAQNLSFGDIAFTLSQYRETNYIRPVDETIVIGSTEHKEIKMYFDGYHGSFASIYNNDVFVSSTLNPATVRPDWVTVAMPGPAPPPAPALNPLKVWRSPPNTSRVFQGEAPAITWANQTATAFPYNFYQLDSIKHFMCNNEIVALMNLQKASFMRPTIIPNGGSHQMPFAPGAPYNVIVGKLPLVNVEQVSVLPSTIGPEFRGLIDFVLPIQAEVLATVANDGNATTTRSAGNAQQANAPQSGQQAPQGNAQQAPQPNAQQANEQAPQPNQQQLNRPNVKLTMKNAATPYRKKK